MPVKADRSAGAVNATPEELRTWASEQAQFWKDDLNDNIKDSRISLLAHLDADLTGIYICYSNDGPLDPLALREWARGREHIFVFDTSQIDFTLDGDELTFWDTITHQRLDLDEEMLVVSEEATWLGTEVFGELYPDKRWKPLRAQNRSMIENGKSWWYFHQRTVFAIMMERIAEGWGCRLEAVLDKMPVDSHLVEIETAEADEINNAWYDWCVIHP
jgi:hypothetical protein